MTDDKARRRKHWGWGYEDQQPSSADLRATAPMVRERLGFGGDEVAEPVPLEAVELAADVGCFRRIVGKGDRAVEGDARMRISVLGGNRVADEDLLHINQIGPCEGAPGKRDGVPAFGRL